ncbi:two-component system OmpR family sensor kinase [Diaminobutyricimonas aerilata]|uniref:histidine kinase n=1 Tax=Diaminobutyricimonas aerilata TaxID=1162967 RepID=A0A2M9CM86_9MICO|nr:HAMP domain-containing sensor histidine kinase [Diaminobutyricimonas aerilata]PJJ73012.1 two-component system OmpR family sensor kinase [Diaminobutyricimonas aerilata]
MHRHLSAWWNGISLRTKITGVTVLLLTLGLLVAGAGTMSLLNAYLLQEVDSRVATARDSLANESIERTSEGCKVSTGPTEEYYIAVISADGDDVLCDNRGVGQPAPDLSKLSFERTQDFEGQAFTAYSPGKVAQWRVIASEGRIAGTDADVSVVVGLDLTSTNDVVARFAAIFMFFAIAVVVLGGALTRLLVMTTFAPLRDVEETAARFADGDFNQRMSGALPNTEVGRLNRSLNAMLARIDRAFADRAKTIEQMRRFVGDASHELRTPLVSVRGYAELYRMGAIASEHDVAQAMDRIEKEAIRMSELVSDLLELARLDEARPVSLAPVDLVPIAHDVALDATAQSPDRTVTVVPLEFEPAEVEAPTDDEATPDADAGPTRRFGLRSTGANATGPVVFSGERWARLRNRRGRPQKQEEAPLAPRTIIDDEVRASVSGDENKIRQVVTNLMGNAMRYTPDGSPIEIGVGADRERGYGVIAVIDHGPGIPPQLREKIFQRFWRADSSRTRETGGSGLGLAIVSAIVRSHNGVVEVDETPGGGATFRVLLPLLPTAEPSPTTQSTPAGSVAGS